MFQSSHRYWAVICLASVFLIFPDVAHAQGGGLFDSATKLFEGIVDLLTNVWAQLFGIIAVFVCGVLWLSGRLEFRHLIGVVGGLVLIFGAAAIVEGVSGAVK